MNYKIYILYKQSGDQKKILHIFSRKDLALSAANYYNNTDSKIILECQEGNVETYFIPLQDP